MQELTTDSFWGQPDVDLSGQFPLVLSRIDEDAGHRLLVSVTPELACFRGHFPGNPILAGVTQLHWAASASCVLFGFDEPPRDVKRLKFKNVVSPPMVLELALRKTADNAVQFEFVSPGHVHSEGCLVFGGGIKC